MPITADISNVKCKVFGISFLNDSEHQKVQKLWEDHFFAYTAFLVRARYEMSKEDIVRALCAEIEKQGISTLHEDKVVISLFLDLTEGIAAESIAAIGGISNAIKGALPCKIQLTIQFGYLGKLAFSDRAALRNSISQVVAENVKHDLRCQLCLVAAPILSKEGANNWKATIEFIDLLRRSATPTSLIPATADLQCNNDVGYLSYGEHSENQRARLEEEIKRLKQLMGKEGGDNVRLAVQQKLEEIDKRISEKYHVDGTVFPLHTDMIVENKFLSNNQKKAAQGKYQPYSNAAAYAGAALGETARKIRESVDAEIEKILKNVAQDLDDIIENQGVGVGLLNQHEAMMSYLGFEVDRVSPPSIPPLGYKEIGCTDDITKYLRDTINYRIAEGKKAYVAALKKSYDELYNAGFRKRTEDYNRRFIMINERLNSTTGGEDYYVKSISGLSTLEAEFHPIRPTGISRKYIVVRGQKCIDIAQKYMQTHEGITTYSLDENICGIPEPDDAPMKIIGISFNDCTEENLLDLIPEVKI